MNLGQAHVPPFTVRLRHHHSGRPVMPLQVNQAVYGLERQGKVRKVDGVKPGSRPRWRAA